MKKLLLVFILGLSFLTFSQGDSTQIQEYPKPYIVDGDTIGGILTIDQLQKIDKDKDLLVMYKDLLSSYKETDDFSLVIIDEYQNKISVLEVKVKEMKSIEGDKDNIILKLKEKISLYEENEDSYKKKLNNKDKIIDEKDKVIKKQRNKIIWGGIGAGVAIIIVTILAIF
jgi:hypothetical protein